MEHLSKHLDRLATEIGRKLRNAKASRNPEIGYFNWNIRDEPLYSQLEICQATNQASKVAVIPRNGLPAKTALQMVAWPEAT
jgi:hypothetical protein